MTNKLTFALGGFAALTLLVLFASSLFTNQLAGATSPSATVISVATTSTAYSVTDAVSLRILATTTNPLGEPGVTAFTRVYATICNPSASVVHLNMSGDRPVTASSSVAQIAAAAGYSSCYEITDRNLYSGSVQASSTVGTVKVFVSEYVR